MWEQRADVGRILDLIFWVPLEQVRISALDNKFKFVVNVQCVGLILPGALRPPSFGLDRNTSFDRDGLRMGGHGQHSLSSRELEESIRAQHLNDPKLGNFLLYSKPSEYRVPFAVSAETAVGRTAENQAVTTCIATSQRVPPV